MSVHRQYEGTDGTVELVDGAVVIRRIGMQARTRGAELVIPIAAITDVQLSRPGLMPGKIYFKYLSGPSNGVNSPSSVMFVARHLAAFEELRSIVVDSIPTPSATLARDARAITFVPNPALARLRARVAALKSLITTSKLDRVKSEGIVGLNRAILHALTQQKDTATDDLRTMLAKLENTLANLEAEEDRAQAEWKSAWTSRRNQLEYVVAAIENRLFATSGQDEPTEVSGRIVALRHPSLAPPHGRTAEMLACGEWAVVEYAVDLIGFRKDGYSISASVEGEFGGHSEALSLAGDRWGLSVGSVAGRISADLSGSLDPRERRDILDTGRLVITSERIVFIGARRSDEIHLRDILGASGDPWTLDLKWPQKRDGEVYRLLDGDIIAQLIVALKRRTPMERSREVATSAIADSPTSSYSMPRDTTQRIERDCPWCAEPILARARVCKHCGRDVEEQ